MIKKCVNYLLFNMASSDRIELSTYCLGGNCSILLSYEDTNKLYHITTKNRIKNKKIGIKIKEILVIEFNLSAGQNEFGRR